MLSLQAGTMNAHDACQMSQLSEESIDKTSIGKTGNRPGGFAMRGFAAAMLTTGLLLLASAWPANAYGTRHAFCLQGGEEYPGLSNCTFDTYAQCQASASGRNLSCIANPYFSGESDDPYAYQNRGRAFPPNYIPVPPMAYPRRGY